MATKNRFSGPVESADAENSGGSKPGNATGAEIEREVDTVDLNRIKQEIFLKILVLGDLGVGKTALIKKCTESSNKVSKE